MSTFWKHVILIHFTLLTNFETEKKQQTMKKIIFGVFSLFTLFAQAQKVDYSVVSVPEESGNQFVQITTASDYVCMPIVKRSSGRIDWLSNRILDTSVDGFHIAYLSARNNTTNIFIKEVDKQGSSVQRTNRSAVLDFSYSPDGKYICFSETRGKENQIFQTSATEGYVCRQVTSGNQDYSPIYSANMKQIFFSRMEAKSTSIWSYDIEKNFLSTHSNGMNPCPLADGTAFLCARINASGRCEIWRINNTTGSEECIISDPNRSFTTPTISPDGRWIVFVGESRLTNGNLVYLNTDIFAAKIDGTNLVQLTYHAADDLSPVWSKNGKYIYFISQRGSADGTANIWRMNFNY